MPSSLRWETILIAIIRQLFVIQNQFDPIITIICYPKSIWSNDNDCRFDHNKDFLDKEGNVTWLSSAIFKSSCFINVEFFPFDEQVDFPFVVKLILILFPVRNVSWSSQVGPMTGFRLEDLVTTQCLECSRRRVWSFVYPYSLLYSVGKKLSQHKSPAWTQEWQIIYWGKYFSSWTCWILRRAQTWATMFRTGSGIWWGAKFSQLEQSKCWMCGLATCATETW